MQITLRLFLILLLPLSLMAQTPRLIIDSKGHTGLVNRLLFLDGGRKLISVGNDKTIRLWDVNTGGLIRTLYVNQTDGYHGRIYSAALTPDEKHLAVAGFMGKQGGDSLAIGCIYLISLEKPGDIRQLKGHTNVVTDLLTIEDKLLSASADGKVRIWSVMEAQPKTITTFSGHRFPISRIAVAPKSKRIASADIYGNVVVWNLTNGQMSTDKIGKFHDGAITSLAFSDDESLLFTGGADGKLIKWLSAGKFLETLEEGSSAVNAMLPIRGENKLLYLAKHGSIKNLETGSDLLAFDAHNNTVSAVAMAPFTSFAGQPGVYVATAGGDEKEIFIWNTNNGNVVRKFASQGHGIFAGGQTTNGQAIAFGQSNPTDVLEDAPLEKVFDLSTFQLKDISKDEKVSQFKRQLQGMQLSKETTSVLSTGSANLRVDEQRDGEIRSYTFLGDDNTIAIGTTFGVSLFSKAGELIGRLPGHNGEVWSVTPLGSDLLVSTSADQSMKIWNFKTKELLLSYFPANDREWVIWSPSGYYHASAGGEKYIGWLLNGHEKQLATFHELSEFRKKFHRPDLITAILKEKSLQNAAKTLNIIIQKEEDIVKLLPPKITWINPGSFTTTTTGNQFEIKASVESNNPVKNLKLMVNGRPFAQMAEIRTEKTGTGLTISYTLDFSKISFQTRGLEVVPASEVEVQKKDVTIQLFAENEVSHIVTDSRTISWQSGGDNRVTDNKTTPVNQNTTTTNTVTTNDAGKELPSLYMVTIGVSKFVNTNYNLNYADADARSIEAVFKAQEGKLFRKVNNFSLVNENATRAKILTAFDRLKQVVTAKDFVVIFIATHGLNRDNRFYILPHDGDASKANVTCVDWRDFSDVVGNLPSQVLLLVDACHSGQLGKNLGQAADNTEAVRHLSTGEYGVVIMAASTGAEYSLEHADWQHGAFTLSLIEGLEKHKADIRADGTIYIRELDFYVAERVKDLTNNQQHPTTQKPSSISLMPVVKY